MLKFGTDPEFFAVTEIDGRDVIISPALFIKFLNVKVIEESEKHPVFVENSDFKIIMDGVAFEVGYKKPFLNAKEMFNNIKMSLECLEEFINRFTWEGNGLKLLTKPVAPIIPEMYHPFIDTSKDNFDNTIYQGFIFGCDPDLDAWNRNYICTTVDAINHPFRYGGMHFHISGNDLYKDFPVPMIKLMSVVLGNYFTLHSPYPEEDKLRVETYGRAGRYRIQERYPNGDSGLEYRSPSNSWASYDLELMEGVIEMAKLSDKFLIERRVDILEQFGEPSVKAIETADKILSKNLLEEILK